MDSSEKSKHAPSLIGSDGDSLREAFGKSLVRLGLHHHDFVVFDADVAGGTGDMSVLFRKAVGETGLVVTSDINNAMLSEGRDRQLDRGISSGLQFVQVNAEFVPVDR